MVRHTATILKFAERGEKTGWTYVTIPALIAEKLKPAIKKSFRVKGFLDDYKIEQVALLPMGGGDFVMALNASMRKGIKKKKGAMLNVKLQVDTKPIKPPTDFIECLKDEPKAFEFFYSLPKGHQNYFGKWIDSAKTEQTKTKRIAQAVNALSKKYGFSEMMRSLKNDRKDLMQ